MFKQWPKLGEKIVVGASDVVKEAQIPPPFLPRTLYEAYGDYKERFHEYTSKWGVVPK